RLLGCDDVAAGVSRVANRERRRRPDGDEIRSMVDPSAGRRVLRLHQLRMVRRSLRTPAGIYSLHDCRSRRRAGVRLRGAIAVDAMFFAVGAVLVWLLPETKGAEL